MRYFENITKMIGNTPLLRLSKLAPEHQVFAKCEFMNPLSIKDRPVLQIIEDARERGELKPGSTVIECTSGNTGMAVSYISAVHGYKAILVMSEIQSIERRMIMAALGAELVLTPAAEGTAGAKKRVTEICAENPDYFYVGQHVSPSNPKAHYTNTGPELWRDTEGKIDVLVAALGTGGTLCGAGKHLKEQKPGVKLIAVEPEESPFISKGIFKPHRMMGTAPGFVPETLDREIIDEINLVSEDEAFEMCRRIAREEGILVGISAGAVVVQLLRMTQQEEYRDKVVVGVLADSGQRYLSVEGLFDA